jgi:hypothetical protein
MNTVYLDDADDPVDIRYDNVFKAVFTRNTPESRTALSRLVSAITGRPLTVLSLNANEPPIDSLRDRQIRFDLSCKAGDGELVNIEMSLNPDTFELVRAIRRSRIAWNFWRGSSLPARTSGGAASPTMT